ncbi:MATE family efflux transporter [Peptococcus simiae]|uniref:Multidrug export protein MepA n=1 Tax=Peptococcus simiae TaxID=1643805 RepID=A0ABW9GY72_9FIRM
MEVKGLRRDFTHYVSLNAIAMLGFSFYVLADTFFIAYYIGADGLAALSLALPVFYIAINGPGILLGIGSAALFSISIGKRQFKRASQYSQTALATGVIYALALTALFWLFRDEVCRLMGAEGQIFYYVRDYLSYLVTFTLAFVLFQVFLATLRNDGSPRIAMVAMLVGNLVNTVFDWFLMGPLDMGLDGAALATGASPLSSLLVVVIHFFKDDRYLSLRPFKPDFSLLPAIARTGLPAFITDASNGVSTYAFNRMILFIANALAVSAYSIILNTALVIVYILTGIAQGVQPLLSLYFGRGEPDAVRRLWQWAIRTMLVASVCIVVVGEVFAPAIVSLFNTQGDAALQALATPGMRYYYLAFIPMALNILAVNALAAVTDARSSVILSLCRALVFPIPVVIILGNAFHLTGVWLTIPLAEGLTFLVFLVLYRHSRLAQGKSVPVTQSLE